LERSGFSFFLYTNRVLDSVEELLIVSVTYHILFSQVVECNDSLSNRVGWAKMVTEFSYKVSVVSELCFNLRLSSDYNLGKVMRRE